MSFVLDGLSRSNPRYSGSLDASFTMQLLISHFCFVPLHTNIDIVTKSDQRLCELSTS